MDLYLISEWLITKEFERVVDKLCEELFPEVEALNHLTVDQVEPGMKIILMGRAPAVGRFFAKEPDRWVPPAGVEVYKSPSLREIMFTAGGLTKFSYAVNLYIQGVEYDENFTAPFTRISADTPISDVVFPCATGDTVVDIEVSGDVSKDEPDDCDLISVAVLTTDEQAAGGYRITVWDRTALAVHGHTQRLREILLRAKERTAHNGKFDFRWINRILELSIFPEEDTMLMHHSMFHGAGEHGLKQLAQRILGAPEWEEGIEEWVPKLKKDGVKNHTHYERIPDEVLTRYNAQDVFWTWQLKKRFIPMLEANPDAMKVYRGLEMPASHMFQEVEGWGMKVDVEYVKGTLTPYFDDQLEHKVPYLHAVAERPLNPNSPPQVKAWFKDHGILLKSTDKDTMTMLRMNNMYPDVVDAIIDVRKLIKAQGTYVTGPMSKIRWDDKVHPQFKIHGTTTGRLSCSNPNVQNVPNDDENEDGRPSLRRVYIPSYNDWSITGADFAQVELRVVAALCGDERMLYDLRPGAPDFFDNLLNVIWPNIDFSTMTALGRKVYRLREKRIVHGGNYGRGAKAIAAALTLEGTPTTVEQVQAIQDAYFGGYPKLAKWRAEAMEHVKRQEWVTPFGRAYQQDVISHSTYNSTQNGAWAFYPQGTASDICLTAALRMHAWLKEMKMLTRIICLVHDAIYLEGPDEEVAAVTTKLQEIMPATGAEIFPFMGFPVEIHTGKSWDAA